MPGRINSIDEKRAESKFHEGGPELSQLETWFPREGVLVLDDLMTEEGNDKEVLDLFYQTFSRQKHYVTLSMSRSVSTWKIC